MRGKLSILVVTLFACACSAEVAEPVDAPDAAPDAGAAEPQTTCCELRNARGERLNYMCGEAVSVTWAEGRGYRCWQVP